MYWAAGAHLYTPLPFRPGQGSFGNHIKTHVFFNAGNLIALDSGNLINYLRQLREGTE